MRCVVTLATDNVVGTHGSACDMRYQGRTIVSIGRSRGLGAMGGQNSLPHNPLGHPSRVVRAGLRNWTKLAAFGADHIGAGWTGPFRAH